MATDAGGAGGGGTGGGGTGAGVATGGGGGDGAGAGGTGATISGSGSTTGRGAVTAVARDDFEPALVAEPVTRLHDVTVGARRRDVDRGGTAFLTEAVRVSDGMAVRTSLHVHLSKAVRTFEVRRGERLENSDCALALATSRSETS